MITVLTGENSFEVSRALDEIVGAFVGDAEKFDGGDLELNQLPNVLQGGTLFATERLIVIRDLSENKNIWTVFSDWLPRVSDEIHLVLVEPKPDKRMKTYKDLQKHATLRQFASWGDNDVYTAEKWAMDEAKRQGITLDKKSAQALVQRTGLDQWRLFHALEKLAVLDEITLEGIERTVEANPTENVFNLFDAALRGDTKRVHEMIRVLERTDDPYLTFGLMAGQVFQLSALASTDKKPADIASQIGAHPYSLGKLAPHAQNLGRSGVRRVAQIFAETDRTMKSNPADPWVLVEHALIKTASV